MRFRIRSKTPDTTIKLQWKAKPLRRLRFKTSPLCTQQACVPELDDWAAQEKSGCKRQVYLVTLPHPRKSHSSCGKRLVAPGARTKQQVLACFLDAAARPAYSDGRSVSRGSGVPLSRIVLAREYHKADDANTAFPHDHLAVCASASFRFAPVKQALLALHGVASHWSCTHNGYWSAVRYVHMPSPKKPRASLDGRPVLWCADGEHPPLHECCHEPLTAAALQKRAEDKCMAAAERGEPERVTELDVFPIVVSNNFRPSPGCDDADLKLIQYAKANCSSAMQNLLFRLDRRDQLKSLINSIWKWETVGQTLAEAQMPRLAFLDAASKSDCVCSSHWATHVTASFIANGISVADLCTDVYNSLKNGRVEVTPVLVMAGARGGEGKSLFFKGLNAVFGDDNVFHTPEPGNFPLMDLVGAKIAFLDDWRFDCEVLPFATQCRWYDGSAVTISQPQNRQGTAGHLKYTGDAPIFATTKLDDMEKLEKLAADDPRTGKPSNVNASMCFRRLKIYAFRTKIAKPPVYIRFCRRCFADLVLSQARRD